MNEIVKFTDDMISQSRSGRRLDTKSIVLTGAAGSIGRFITRQLLREGARVMLTGRDIEKLDDFVDTLCNEGFDRDSMVTMAGDCADPQVCREIVAKTVESFGTIDVLVNNAGAAGPKFTLRDIPFTEAEKRASDSDQTMFDSAMNLLGAPWHMARAAAPHMSVGASIINVSTIFSRTHYYGRIPYVVPKSGLNALSKGLALELGEDRGIRVNTIFPGPIESERIDTVFARMDELQGLEPGSTGKEFKDLMITTRDGEDGLAYRYPTPDDVASAITWLASNESAALSGHHVEVTNGMQVPAQSRSQLVSWPDKRLEDLTGSIVLILGGSDYNEAVTFAQRHTESGAQVLLAFRNLEAVGHARSIIQAKDMDNVQLSHLDPLRRESMDRTMQFIDDHFGRLDGVIVLPQKQNGHYGYSISTATDEDVENFVRDEVVAPVAFASTLATNLSRWFGKCEPPAITYVTNSSDGHGNLLNDVIRASNEALIRGWRHEDDTLKTAGELSWAVQPNQLVRYDTEDRDALPFAADWAATLTNRVRQMDPINLWIPKDIKRATGKGAMPTSIMRVLPGLHKGKTAVITGGSLGIGLQLGRYLAIAGARVLLSARSESKLIEAQQEIAEELRGIGYPNPESRIHILADIDVGDPEALDTLHQHAVDLFGQVDFLINNAGISGAEEMVVDMTLKDWNRTMEANLISNYSLIRKFGPLMKDRGTGSILNVSSYFGGEKYVAVAYPNRADYAVSKAGQRVLAEILSRHLGPEIQINALAPGPVDGARLRGLGDAPGLFDRRGRLVLENKRLNQVHAAIIAAVDAGYSLDDVKKLSGNALAVLPTKDLPRALSRLYDQVKESGGTGSANQCLMHMGMAVKLVERLVLAGIFTEEDKDEFLGSFVDAPSPFFDKEASKKSASQIESGILNRLHLHKMPTDEQVGLSTVFHLADEIVSGETFHPSGGLKFDRSVTEGELLLSPSEKDLAKLNGKRVVLIGDGMKPELTEIANGFTNNGVDQLWVLTKTEDTATALRHSINTDSATKVEVRCIGDDIEAALDDLLRNGGGFDVVVSSPFERLPLNALAGEPGNSWDRVLSDDQFRQLVNDQLTHHFRSARIAALVPNCQIVLITPDTSLASTREEFALALFVKNSLHAFTVTLGVEGERLPTVPAVNQVQLTRRAHTEEPSNDQELSEEMERLVAAVMQCAVPAPSPKESRYLSKIFRGNAVTV
jgi:malonyl-CoA reductase/3-hydroxypropionate dehydrogenase (NADP+)